MKHSMIILAAILATGCTSLDTAGHAGYTVKIAPRNCELTVADGKEYKGRSIALDCAAGQFAVTEEGVKAFPGQALAVKAANIMPTMGLADIIAPRDK